MQRKFFLICFFFIGVMALSFIAHAQQKYGFEWIKKYQPYYKFKIAEKGLYRIDSLNLASNGITLLNVDPKKLQIFRNGVEQSIYIKGQEDGVFNAGDFVELYAEPNDGLLDTELYRTTTEQPHTFRSLFTDTAYYFITILPDTSVQNGKRFSPFNDNDYASYTPEPFYEVSLAAVPQEDYYYGAFIPAYKEKYYLSEYGDAEGMMSFLIGLNQQRAFTFKTSHAAAAANTMLEIKLIGASDNSDLGPDNNNHHVKVYSAANGINPILLIDTTFKGYGEQVWFRQLGNSGTGDSTTIIIQVVNDLGVSSDFIGVSYIKLSYNKNNQSLNNNEYLTLKNSLTALKTLIQVNNYLKSNPLVYDLTNLKRVMGVKSGNLFNALLPYTSLNRKLLIIDETDVKNFPLLKQVFFPQIDPGANYQYLIISHPLLQDAATQYKAYRSKKYNTLLVYSEELFDTYFYGNPHPLAIRRFCEHLYKQQNNKPEFLLLLGRGYQNNLIKNLPSNYNLNLVPAIGVPSSDHLFTNDFDKASGAPSIATGRIAAATNTEALNYFQKLVYYETNPDSIQRWRKDYLHLSGGDRIDLQTQFKNVLAYNAEKIRHKPVGGKIIAYGKTTIVSSSADLKTTLIERLNKGVNMMTFYGHGSLTVLDIDFGSIYDLQTTNRCAFYYFNGCNVGNANDVDPQGTGLFYAKDFICSFPSKGAIGWLAHTNLTYTNYLETQMEAFYNQVSGPGYGLPVGLNIKNALSVTSSANDEFSRSHALQILLQGDPAVVLYAPALPDYKIVDEDLFISPPNATVQNDSMAIGIIISNLAKATGDTISIFCTRTLPDNKVIDYPPVTLTGPFYADTFYYWIKPLHKSEIGLNVFKVKVNADQKIKEIQYSNNEATISYFLPGSGIHALLPYNYSIVNADTIALLIQNNNLAANNVSYIFEFDTSLNFSQNSPFFDSVIITGSALTSWIKILPVIDSTVFYWRARLNVPTDQGGVWVTQSFTYIKNGPTGWRQSKYAQIRDVTGSNLIAFNDTLQRIEFSRYNLTLGIEDKRWDHSRMGVTIPYLLNAGVGTCISEGTIVLIFEPFQVDFPYELPNYPFNCAFVQANKSDQSVRYYPFNTNFTAGETALKRLIDSVPEGYIVAMFSRYSTGIANWSANTKSLFASIGSYKVEQVKSGNTAWSVIGKKGDPIGFAAEDTMNYNNTLNDTSFTITRNFRLKGFKGDFTSALVGPAKSYNHAKLVLQDEDPVAKGRWWWQVTGVTKEGVDTVLMPNLTTNQIALNQINAKIFPYLKLQLFNVDSAYRTPLQIIYWQVDYDPATEVTVDLNTDYSFYKEQLEQGDTIKITLPLKNIGYSLFDSSLLSVQVLDENRLIQYQSVQKLAPINAGGSWLIKEKISTRNLTGKQTLIIKANSDKQVPEINYNNDFFSKEFIVKGDKSSPFLDVTFDGQRILNGDFVSPAPVIRISSTDQNKFLLQKDTSTFALYLRKPGQFDFERINLTQNSIQFIPASDKQNQAVLQYAPTGLKDGLYTLKVQAADVSGNKAGGNEFMVDFNVINKTTISHFYPYPNPFTTHMRFVFTLTGSIVPEQLMVRIMTITGKVVREVSKEEFGPMHIGNNISEFAWDGTDQYGDRLANGVYLYQVYTRIGGKELENRATKAKEEQSFFNGNTGKIYLMR